MLRLVDVYTYYGESLILQGISLEVKEGSVVALLGRNGMGKTTTIRSIIGFTPPRQGNVVFRGESIAGLPPYQISRKGIGLVPQGRRLFSSLSVRENLTLAMRNPGGNQAWNLEKVYSYFPILKERAHFRSTLLSGGEQQMLTIARALMSNPELLLMDEPSEGLAPLLVRSIGEIIGRFRASGISILLVEQNVSFALSVADYVYIISKGRIVHATTPDELRKNKEIMAKYIGV